MLNALYDSVIVIKAPRKAYIIGMASGLIYGLCTMLYIYNRSHIRNVSNASHEIAYGYLVMSVGFLFLVPLAIGWLCSTFGGQKSGWLSWIFLPWLPIIVSDALLLILGYEGRICILMALPITFLFSSAGGVLAGLTRRYTERRSHSTAVCIALLPFAMIMVEAHWTAPLNIRTVQTAIVIHAPASIVWQNIERVPAIAPTELRPTWTHRIGFPRPIEATLSYEGAGGVRHASFQGGLLFIETVTNWQPDRLLGFTIKADTAEIPRTTLDEHVTIGGPYFDVLRGQYRIEPKPDGTIVLHLSSQERLSTDFNWYAGLWTDAVMHDIQQSILEVVKKRCEHNAILTP